MKTCPTCNATYPSRFSVCPQDGAKLAETSGWDDGAIIRGKYRILSKLGQGGMGAVYKASHMVFDELRALKVINPELTTDETFVKRFKQEAVIARKLDHPNAVRVDDLDESEDGLPFIVMEYIEGRSLKDLIEKEGPVEPHRAVRIASQVAAALDAAHRLGMVHRDIKPANIVLIQSPAGEQAKVLDFGIAKIKEARSADSSGMTLTGTGIVVGTPQYMSPEQALGKRGSELDGRSDLYSLGVVLYQMLTGQLPFKADTTMQILLAHINTPPRPILDVRPDSDIPPSLAAVVMKCLAKDSHDRPASGAALIEALRAAETGSPPAATTDLEDASSATQVLRPQQPAQRVEAVLPSSAVTPRVPAATPLSAAPPEPIAQAAETGRKTRSSHNGMIAGIIAALVVIGIVAVALVMHPFKHGPSSPPAATSAAVPAGTAAPSSTEPSSAPSAAPSGETAASPPDSAETTNGATTSAPGTAGSAKLEKTAETSEAGRARGPAQNRGTAAESRNQEKAPPASKPAQAPAQSPSETLVAKATPPPAAVTPAGNPSLSTVIIETAPGAQIFVDGKSAGVASATGRLTVANLPAGTHDLRASLSGFNDIDYTIQLPPAATSIVHASWGASQARAASVTPKPGSNAAAAQSVAASYPVEYLHTFGSSKGLLVIDGGNVHYQPSDGGGAFVSPLSGISWGSSGSREFYIRLKDGGLHRFRSTSAGEILATLNRAAQAQGRPSLEQ